MGLRRRSDSQITGPETKLAGATLHRLLPERWNTRYLRVAGVSCGAGRVRFVQGRCPERYEAVSGYS